MLRARKDGYTVMLLRNIVKGKVRTLVIGGQFFRKAYEVYTVQGESVRRVLTVGIGV